MLKVYVLGFDWFILSMCFNIYVVNVVLNSIYILKLILDLVFELSKIFL